MDDADKYILRQLIAGVLDHPSAFMGGPSPGSVRRAIRIVNALAEYDVTPSERAAADAAEVRTWRKSPWDSLERE